MSIRPILLDATLRDGGYQNANQFTPEEVRLVVSGVAASGVEWIEIGHGFGLGADRTMGAMGATDVEYLRAVGDVPAKIGMFANVNMCTVDDLRRAVDSGLDFVRIGFIGFDDPHPFDGALELAEVAKQLGLWTALNMVRTPMYRDSELIDIAKRSADVGADSVYVVDSSGGMLPAEVSLAVHLLVESGAPSVGFHGHQNLDLGVANSLAAVEAGAEFVDGTLQGIGRDSGNTQLEVLAVVLQKAGFDVDVDLKALCDVGNKTLPTVLSVSGISEEMLMLGKHDLLSHGLPLAQSAAHDCGVPWQDVMGAMRPNGPFFETAELAKAAAESLRNA